MGIFSNYTIGHPDFFRSFRKKQYGTSRHLLSQATKNEVFCCSQNAVKVSLLPTYPGEPTGSLRSSVFTYIPELTKYVTCTGDPNSVVSTVLRPEHASYSRLRSQCKRWISCLTTPNHKQTEQKIRGNLVRKPPENPHYFCCTATQNALFYACLR